MSVFIFHVCSIYYISCLYSLQHRCNAFQHTDLGVAVQHRCRAGQGRHVAAHSLLETTFSRTCNDITCSPCGVHVLERHREGVATISNGVHLAAEMNCSAAHCSWSCIASQMQGRAGQESCSTHLTRSHILQHLWQSPLQNIEHLDIPTIM